MSTPPSPADLRRYRANLQSEVDGAAVYAALPAPEQDPARGPRCARRGPRGGQAAAFWEQRLHDAGAAPAKRTPSWRARILIWSARHWGADAVLPRVASMESAGQDQYAQQLETAGTQMTAEEREHARVLSSLVDDARGGEPRSQRGTPLLRVEGRHKSIGGNALRAAVLGANDGLCSNLSLVMAVAGANVSGHAILLTGFAGLVAGAGSMALGEWVSVQSSRELFERQLRLERDELAATPEEEREELQMIYEAKGLDAAAARELSRRLVADPARALDLLAREELGIDPAELGGSPWVAAGSSMLLFAVGALVPVLPFLFASGPAAVIASLLAGGIALFGIGAAISVVTGRSPLFSGARQLVFGLGAAGLTFALGKLVGVALG